MGLNTLASLRRNPTIILYISILLYTLVLSYLAILKHYAFMSTAWDLGIYEQVLWSTANTGRFFWYTPELAINPSCNFFGIHFSPILFLVLPVYAIFQATETLLVLQVFFLALGTIPLYKLVFYESRSHKQALIFALTYLVFPPIHGVALFDFHVQAFLPFLFFSAFYYFKKQEWGKYFLFIILSLMVIEFIPLIVVFFGLYGLWVNRKKIFHLIRILNFRGFLSKLDIFFSIITIILGLVWFIIARNIISSINPSAPPHPNWAFFGDPVHDLPGFIFSVLANPIRTLEVIITPVDQKIVYIFGLFAPLAFLSFLDLPLLMIGAPWFLVAFLSDYSPYYTPIGYQYVAFVVPFIFVSAVYGVKRLFAVKHRFGFFKKFSVVSKKIAGIQHWRTLAILFLVSVITISYVTVLGIHVNVPVITEHNRVAEAFTRLIPSNASVLTQNDLFPHLSRRLYAYVVGGFSPYLPSNITFDYILIDTESPWFEDSLESLVYNLIRDATFGVQYAADGIWLLKKNYTGGITYPIKNGVFVNFYNQGVVMKLFDDVSFFGEPAYENVTLSIFGSLRLNIPQEWVVIPSFALTFEGWLYAPVSGNYSFRLESTGSSKLCLDGEQVLYNGDSAYYDVVFLDCIMWLERGFHSINVEYVRENYIFPYVHLLWEPPWEIDLTEIQSAFIYSKISPDASSSFLDLSWDFGSGSPFVLISRDHFSAFVNCSMYAPLSGVYKFKVLADGYASISIDGKLVSSSFENSTQTEFEVLLNQGDHVFQIDYMTLQGDARLSVMWQPPGGSNFEEIPSSHLSWQGG